MISTWVFVVALALFGFVLLMLELFVVPGFGITGISGIVAILGAVYYANKHLGTWEAALIFVATFVLSLAVVLRAARSGSLTKLKNPSVSPGKVGDETNPTAKNPLVGARGVAVTQLHPAGIIQIGDRRYDVVVDGPIVEQGEAVEVMEVAGNLIKVRAL